MRSFYKYSELTINKETFSFARITLKPTHVIEVALACKGLEAWNPRWTKPTMSSRSFKSFKNPLIISRSTQVLRNRARGKSQTTTDISYSSTISSFVTSVQVQPRTRWNGARAQPVAFVAGTLTVSRSRRRSKVSVDGHEDQKMARGEVVVRSWLMAAVIERTPRGLRYVSSSKYVDSAHTGRTPFTCSPYRDTLHPNGSMRWKP